MTSLVRFGVSLEEELLKKFDKHIKKWKYTNRSEAIRDLIRNELVLEEWEAGKEITGSVTLVYNHHKRELVNNLVDIQHDCHEIILSTQHIHLDHNNCLEIIIVKGKPQQIQELYGKLKSAKGVKHGGISTATTGREIV